MTLDIEGGHQGNLCRLNLGPLTDDQRAKKCSNFCERVK
jgi:hypothetical protein